MKLDMQRIWKRNLGRDDRCIADNGKEVYVSDMNRNSNLFLFVLCFQMLYIYILSGALPFFG